MIHPASISSIYSQYIDSLYAYALQLGFDESITMDAIHDVFYKLCTQKNLLENISNLKFYLFRALKNRLIDIYRTRREFPGIEEISDSIYPHMSFKMDVTIEDEIVKQEDEKEIAAKVEKVLSNLTDREREIIYFRYIEEFDYKQIAELMGISVASCRNLISKSMTKLKDVPFAILTVVLNGILFP